MEYVKFSTRERYIHCEVFGPCTKTSSKGVPQRGVLSPLLYILYTSHIAYIIDNRVVVSMFADDIAFYTRLTASQQNLDLLENAVATMSSN